MKLNNIGYLLKEGFRSIFQHGFMSFAAICVTVACLIIVGSFSALAYNLDIMVQDLNKTSEIMVYIDSDLSDAEARSIGTKINLLDNVFDAKYVSREEALQNFVSDHDNDSAFSGVQAQDLRHRYVVTLEDNTKMQTTKERCIETIPVGPLGLIALDSHKELGKKVKKFGEEAKVAVRNIRRDSNDEIKKLEKAKEITEDDSKAAQDVIQKMTAKYVAEVDKAAANKEAEIMEI